jgi:hypothetical protein
VRVLTEVGGSANDDITREIVSINSTQCIQI